VWGERDAIGIAFDPEPRTKRSQRSRKADEVVRCARRAHVDVYRRVSSVMESGGDGSDHDEGHLYSVSTRQIAAT